ncbi:MAG: diaminopimelate epimerase [Oscillospiraceae bacterium]|nr:diaminopimelate epimerase [Oscillospiraceae bacterium]
MRITKMHGAGNDFVIVNNLAAQIPPERFPVLAQKLCAPHTGIGADGMMVVVPAEKGGDFGMRFYNKDGSLGEMCGNGARCICRYGFENGLAGETQRVETTAGLVVGERVDARRYRVRLNDPSVIDLHRKARIDGEDFDCAYVELGDPGIPHAVIQLPEWDTWDTDRLRALGRKLRCAPVFPRGANVSFVKASGADAVKAVTYERGVEDFTLACGTGCGSIAAALTLLGLVSGREVSVSMPGGLLSVTLSNEIGIRDIFLTGPTCLVFEGEVSGEFLEEA